MSADRITMLLEVRLMGMFKSPGFFAWLWEKVSESGAAANDEAY